jgi:serine/threonine protein kinase/formylglycine-generating enzyme required for sulfatase activity
MTDFSGTFTYHSGKGDNVFSEELERIGRYKIQSTLGKGSFGVVYLAHDDQLRRLVAIKVPHRHLVSCPEDAKDYLAEARTVAGFDHPNIVPVHDVNSTPECPFFIVSKFIEGGTLAKRISERRLSLAEAVEVTVIVAETLHYAHRKGVVHRDIKPGNILLDLKGNPNIADFGLALKDEDVGRGPRFAGTPAYMSPEQARREGHRVDGRSDIFSLGVVFYELLTNRRPFHGDSRQELLDQIANLEPRPPRQWDETIPKELERICLKALSKHSSERYTNAKDMAEDLQHFLVHFSDEKTKLSTFEALSSKTPLQIGQPAPATVPMLAPTSSSHVAQIVPKGLRSFDAHDADFFLDLLPGPRDRERVPDSIRFWKTRVEEKDSDSTFPVGLIYGPSGCGKSSLVKAGLLPRLSPKALAIFVEATEEETETRLLNALRKRFPSLAGHVGLGATLAALRCGQGLAADEKVLIVLDQFEQWLHFHKDIHESDLVKALRQCDGGHVQCVVMVRDDFWLAITRFFREIEIELLQSWNIALVDLFDLDHAKRVLSAYGRAFGKLPEKPMDVSAEQQAFLNRAVSGLSVDNKVVCVRLALFAEMMKGRPWTLATLKEVGGAEGVGIAFLEDTFSSPISNPQHRLHQRAARSVLRALVSETGKDIKGNMLSRSELLAASGYDNRPKDFDELVHILDAEVRLITPTDPEGKEDEPSLEDDHGPGGDGSRSRGLFYQLTHDFLVPAIREWLKRKQMETLAGRTQLLLTERAKLWTGKPEAKQLPSFLEWLAILGRTNRAQWSDLQRKMMRVASRRHLIRLATSVLAAAAILIFSYGLYVSWRHKRQEDLASNLVEQVLVADITRVGTVADQLEMLPGPWRSRLEGIANDNSMPHSERLRAHLAMVRRNSQSAPLLVQELLVSAPREFEVILEALQPQQVQCRQTLWSIVTDNSRGADQRFRAAVALAEFDPENAEWTNIAGPTASLLVQMNFLIASEWAKMLRPVRKILDVPLTSIFCSEDSPQAQRTLAASILADYGADDPALLGRLLQKADPVQFRLLFPAVRSLTKEDLETLLASLAAGSAEGDLSQKTRSRANSAAAFLLLDLPGAAIEFLGQNDDPDVRTALIDLLPSIVEFDSLWSIQQKFSNDLCRQAFLLLMEGYYTDKKLSGEEQTKLETRLFEIIARDDSAGVHSATEWLLGRMKHTDRLDKLTQQFAGKKGSGWRVSSTGHTLAVIRAPVEFKIGSPSDEPRRDGGEDQSPRRIPYLYEIGTHEITVAQYLKFFPDHRYAGDVSPTDDCPMNYVSWYDVAKFCRRLSESEGIAESEMVFPPIEEIRSDQDFKLPKNWLRRSGYRMPTEAEWEYACRAGTTTTRFFGSLDKALPKYCWWLSNANERCWPVGSLRPNPIGLFDVLGNVGEWCFDTRRSYSEAADLEDDSSCTIKAGVPRVFRGGYYRQMSKDVRSAKRDEMLPAMAYSYNGFRIARTIPLRSP